MDALVLLGSFGLLCALGVPVAYALGLAALIAALWVDIPLEAVMLKISDGTDDFDYEGRQLSTIGEERRHNPRIGGGAREEDFVGYMRNLGLPHPKQMAMAVPANLRAGRPEQEPDQQNDGWGPVIATYAGVPQIGGEWLVSHRGQVQLVDVRSAAEFDGELGHLTGSALVPLDELRQRAAEVSHDRPVVVICQTGKRSALGALILRKAGCARVANLEGGMLRWRELGLPS